MKESPIDDCQLLALTAENIGMSAKRRLGIIGYGHLGRKQISPELSSVLFHFTFGIFPFSGFVTFGGFGKIFLRGASLEIKGNALLSICSLFMDIDLVIEVAHPAVIGRFVNIILDNCDLFIGSPTCLADADLLESIRSTALAKKRRVLVPAGAFWGGSDIQKMADQGTLMVHLALTITMTKHPSSFKLESSLKELNEAAKQKSEEPTVLYEGPVGNLCPLAPNNVNTMAGGAIAAHNLGFDGVIARLVSDPKFVVLVLKIIRSMFSLLINYAFVNPFYLANFNGSVGA
uniref:DUF108 domain-containing protein n=1 Tax=Angiostrongylus cantonensis TaxID=6313 RepID=A0A0K0DHL5_ANGCA